MKIYEKLNAIKATVTESIEEFAETSDLSAEEYAKYYGASYTNFLNYIKKQKFSKMTENFNEGNEIDEDTEIRIELPILSIKDKEIIFNDEAFGTKERFNMTILKNLLYKARISYEISEDLSMLTLTQDKAERIGDRVEKLSENKEAYFNKAKELVNEGNKIARDKTKKLLKGLSDWADKKL